MDEVCGVALDGDDDNANAAVCTQHLIACTLHSDKRKRAVRYS